MSDSPEGWMSIMEVAAFLPMHHESVRRHIREGRLSAVLVHGAKYLIRREHAEHFKAGYQIAGGVKGTRWHERRLL